MSTNLSDLVPFHTGQVRNFYLLVLGQVKRNYDSVFTKLFRHRYYPFDPIASQGRSVRPSVKYVDLKKKKANIVRTPCDEISGSMHGIYLFNFLSHRSLPRA